MAYNVPMRGLRVEDELYLKLKELARRDNRSYNQEAVHILMQYVEDYEKANGAIVVNSDELYQ